MVDLAPHNPYQLTLRSPLLIAAGCLGYGVEYARLLGLHEATHVGIGALVTRTTTLHAWRSPPLPRLVETAAGLLALDNSHNPGLRTVIERYAPSWASWSLPVIVSIASSNLAECTEMAGMLEGVAGVAGIELQLVACSATSGVRTGQFTTAVRRATLLPLLVKLPLNAQIGECAQAATTAGADALTLVGGFAAAFPDPVHGTLLHGQLCGPATLPLALATVSRLAPQLTIPLVAGGGITSSRDARAFLAAGATAVAIGSALLADPRIAERIGNALGPELAV